MANTKREVQYKQIRPNGEEITRTISGINESAADSTVAAFVSEVSNLSQNTLTAITDVKIEKLPIDFAYDVLDVDSAKHSIGGDCAIYTYATGNNVDITLATGENNDTIENKGNYSKFFTGAGNDSINNSGVGVSIDGDEGNDTLYNTGASVSASLGGGDDSITNSGENVSIYGGYGNDSITNSGDNVSIDSGPDNDSITNSGDNVTINGGSGNDSITNTGNNVSIYSGNGFDTITNSGENVTIDSGTASDSITNSGDFVSIYGGYGNDSITNSGDYAVVSLGTGDDFISLGGENTHVTLQFAGNKAESLNSVYGFDQVNHVIQIINSGTSITDTTINGGDDTRLILTNNAKPSIQTTVDLYGVSSGSVNVKFGNNEVTVYNLGGD